MGFGQQKGVVDIPKSAQRQAIAAVLVSPEVATEWLRRNRANRPLRRRVVTRYARDIAAGAWKDTDESIKFSKSGALIDGQHRLSAIIECGKSLRLAISTGLADDVFDVLDTGASRTGKDVLAAAGLLPWESGTAAAAVHMLINAEKGLSPASSVRYTNQDVLAWWFAHPRFADTINFISSMPRSAAAITHSVAAYLHFNCSKKNVDLADTFIEQIFRGEGLTRTSPVYVLRSKLLGKKLAGDSPSREVQVHASINAWNLVRRGQSAATHKIMPRSDAAMPEIL